MDFIFIYSYIALMEPFIFRGSFGGGCKTTFFKSTYGLILRTSHTGEKYRLLEHWSTFGIEFVEHGVEGDFSVAV